MPPSPNGRESPSQVVAGDPANVKLTTAADIAAADHRLTAEEAFRLGDVRVGIGYDIHSLGPGHEVNLGGVPIAYSRGLVGHSDADVVLHALTDAVLGALAEGDIGVFFPRYRRGVARRVLGPFPRRRRPSASPRAAASSPTST